MAAVKARHSEREMRSGASGVQVGMTLSATGVRSCCQSEMASMFLVASGAIGGKKLIGGMNRPVMARLAAFIAGFGAEHAGLLDVAGAAFGGEDGVRGRNSSAAVHVIVSSKGIPAEPQDCRQRHRHGQNRAQAPEGVRALEVT